MGKRLLFAAVVGSLTVFTSCVSKGKYVRLDAQKTNYEMENKVLKDRVDVLETKVKDLEKTSLKYTETKERELKELGAKLDQNTRTIQELQASMKRQKDVHDQVLSLIKEKLAAYDPADVLISTSNGRIAVSLSDKLMFKPNSLELDAKGKEALKLISEAITNQPGLDVFVEAQTNDAVVKSASIKDGWDLSAMRAASIVRTMTGEYGVQPQQVVAVGKGMQSVTNDISPEGKEQGRKIGIILSPRAEDLSRIVNSN